MDPEVRQNDPGACPKWETALEPVVPVTTATQTNWTCPMHPEIVRDAVMRVIVLASANTVFVLLAQPQRLEATP